MGKPEPKIEDEPAVTHAGLLSMQVCVPEAWTDEQATYFANTANMAGTANGWMIRKEGDEALAGCAERVCCHERSGYVHIMLDC